MKSYSTGRNLAGIWTKNASSDNLSYLDQTANDAYRHLCAMKDWSFLTQVRSIPTVAAQQFYNVPYDCERVQEISVVVSNDITYTPTLSPSKAHWDKLNLSKFQSDIPEWYFILGGNSGNGAQIGLWPRPASSYVASPPAGAIINVTQKCRVIDMQFPDYTTGTITTTAVNAVTNITTVTGSGTSWGTGQAGLWLQITPTAEAGGGDGNWYLVTAANSGSAGTDLTLAAAYGGPALSAASASYTLAQMPLLPENFHDMPWIYAAGTYWQKEADPRAAQYMGQFGSYGDAGSPPSGMVKQLVNAWSNPGGDFVIDTGDDPAIINPNLVIRL